MKLLIYRSILGEAGDGLHDPHPLFCELSEIRKSEDDDETSWEWKETARWVKFEEDVEEVINLLYSLVSTINKPRFLVCPPSMSRVTTSWLD